MVFAVVAVLLAMVESPLRLGIQALERRDFTAAVEHFQQATIATPADPSVWLLLARASFGAGKNEAALAAAAKAEAAGQRDADVLHGLAFLYSEFARDYVKSAEFEARYVAERPNDTAAWSRIGTLYMRADLPQRAMEPATKAYAIAANAQTRLLVEESHFRTSQKQMFDKDFDGAASTLTKARSVLKDSPQIELAFGVALYAQRKFPEAVAQFLHTMELAPDIEQPYVFAGKILKHAGDKMPALLERFHAYRQRNPESHLGYLLAAKALVEQGVQTDEVLSLARQAAAKKADDPEAHFVIGTLLDARGQAAEAAVALEKSTNLRKDDAAAHYKLARVYLKLGRKDDAARERALYEKLSEEADAKP